MAAQSEAAVDVASHHNDPRWFLVERILAASAFKRSPRLADFLRYVTQMTLLGNEEQLSEQRVGESVFGRAHDYDCSADTVVRSSALRLRRQLELYFQREGSFETIILTLPRGGYRVVFEQRMQFEADASDVDAAPLPDASGAVGKAPAEASPQTVLPSSSYRNRILLLCLVVLGLAVLVESILLARRTAPAKAASAGSLWSELFTTNHPTRIVLGDSGLVLFHAVTHQYLSLADYVAHRYEVPAANKEPEFARFLAQRRYTSVVDADALARLTRVPEATPDRTLVKFARDLRLEDLKDGNLILMGAQEADPWVELFERSMDFQFVGPANGIDAHFNDRHAGSGQPQSYSTKGGRVFAVIAFLPNLNDSGKVLLLEGLNMTGTESALDFILERERIEPLLTRLRKPDGTLPYFEVLLECRTVTDTATPSTVIQVRVHPQ